MVRRLSVGFGRSIQNSRKRGNSSPDGSAGQVYGLSARGLAIDTALPSGEEFPRFREFWIERPKPTDKRLTIYALLDSPRATGAYRFVIMPGRDTVVDVLARGESSSA